MTVRGSFEWVESLDVRLARLARGAGALWLSFGLVLEALGRRAGHHDLGFSSLEAYGLEHCKRSKRWIQETRTVARRLVTLSAIRSALLSGKLSWSMTVVLSRVAAPEDEGAWLFLARNRTVRQMKEVIRGLRGSAEPTGEVSAGDSGDSAVGALAGGSEAGRLSAGGPRTGEAAGRLSAGEPGVAGDGASGPAGRLSAGDSSVADSGAPEAAGRLSAGDSDTGTGAAETEGPEDARARVEAALHEANDDWGLDEPEPMRTLTITMDQPDAWLFECARMLVGRISGSTSADAVLEALLGEAESSALSWLPEGASGEIEADPVAVAQRAWEEQLEQWRREAEVLCEPRITKAQAPALERVEVRAVDELMLESPEQLDARLRSLADELARRDVEIGRLAEHQGNSRGALEGDAAGK